jgi:hypothetical protein
MLNFGDRARDWLKIKVNTMLAPRDRDGTKHNIRLEAPPRENEAHD